MQPTKRKHRPPTRPAASAIGPAPDSLRAFLLAAVSLPPEEGLSEEDAAADARVRCCLETLAAAPGDQAAEAPAPPPGAGARSGRWRPPRKPR